MAKHIWIVVTDDENPNWRVEGEGDVDDLEFDFRPNGDVSFKWGAEHGLTEEEEEEDLTEDYPGWINASGSTSWVPIPHQPPYYPPGVR